MESGIVTMTLDVIESTGQTNTDTPEISVGNADPTDIMDVSLSCVQSKFSMFGMTRRAQNDAG